MARRRLPVRPISIPRLAGCVAVASLAACAPDAGPPAAAAIHPASARSGTAAAADPTRAPGFDGVYEGTRTPDDIAACGFPASVGYDVSGSRIRLRTSRDSRRIEGTIAPDGQFAMTNAAGDHAIAGAIDNGHLVATETSPPRRHRKHVSAPSVVDCRSAIDARRIPPGIVGDRSGPLPDE